MKISVIIPERSVLCSEVHLGQVWPWRRCSADGLAMSVLSASPAAGPIMAQGVIAGTGNQCLAAEPEFSQRRSSALTQMLSSCKTFLAEMLRWRLIRQDTRLLMPMDDRILADIGLRRDRIRLCAPSVRRIVETGSLAPCP